MFVLIYFNKTAWMPELEMKGDNMEIYSDHKLARDGGNLTMPEFMRPNEVWLPTRNLSSSCLGDKLHHHFQGPCVREKRINPVI